MWAQPTNLNVGIQLVNGWNDGLWPSNWAPHLASELIAYAGETIDEVATGGTASFKAGYPSESDFLISPGDHIYLHQYKYYNTGFIFACLPGSGDHIDATCLDGSSYVKYVCSTASSTWIPTSSVCPEDVNPCPEKLAPQSGPLHLVGGTQTRFTWPSDWVSISALDLVLAYPNEIKFVTKRVMGPTGCKGVSFGTFIPPASRDAFNFPLGPGDDVNILAIIDFDLYPVCTPGETTTETCYDGSTIARTCDAQGNWVPSPTEQSCPLPECDAGETQTELCWDGSTIVTQECLSGAWSPTNLVCPEETDYTPLLVVGAGIAVLTAFLLMRKK